MTRIALPPPTLSNLVPVSVDHRYFENFAAHPFEPSVTSFSTAKAWWLAEASLLVYGDEPFVRQRLFDSGLMQGLGLSVRIFQGELRGAQCLVMDSDRFAIVAFRGTRIESFPDPFLKFKLRMLNKVDLATDVDLRLAPGTHVHAGFYWSLDEIWSGLLDHLQAIRAEGSGKTIWFTGHSLGAALATIASDRFGAGKAAGLYTFGSPRVGDDVFKASFTVPCYRFVNNTDVVPHLPPPALLANYTHVGDLKFIDSTGRIVGDPTTYDIIDSNIRGHLQSLKAGWHRFNASNLLKAGQAIRDAVGQRDFSTIGEKPEASILDSTTAKPATQFWPTLGDKLESLNLDFVPLAALADHSPIYYTLRIWNALQPDK
jgi:triacylglycerol lipase